MKTREQLIADCQGLVRSLAWQIHCKLPSHVDLEDLVAYGQIGLIEAAQAFDPTRENQFSTYSYYRIRGAILDGLSKMSWFNQASFNGGVYEQQRQALKPPPVPEPEPQKTPEQLINDCQGLVRSLAWQIHCKLPPSVGLDVLIKYGEAGLVEAVRNYDPASPARFSTQCFQSIQEAIFRGLSKTSWFNRADYHGGVYERQAHQPLKSPKSSDESQTAGQRPSDLSGAAGLFGVLCKGIVSGDADEIGDDRAELSTPIDAAMQREMVEKLQSLIEELPQQAQVLIRATYFEGLSLKDAGATMGMSKAWASRLHAKTLDQLAKSFRIAQMIE